MTTKNNVLQLLESKRGQSISGSVIAEQLNVSRNAVWKAVRELEKDGYEIEAVTNKGYCLGEDNDILSVAGILPFLSQKEIADKITVYDWLESTNITAKEAAVCAAEHGTVIIADHQTGGKGRYGRVFVSPPSSGLYMSIVLRPECLPHKGRGSQDTGSLLTVRAAVAVCEAVQAVCGKSPQIKWINDIFLDGKKICGILTEAVTDLESGGIQWAVVGIGVNFTACDSLPDIAGAVFEGKPTVTRNQLAAEIINRMLKSDDIHISQYRERLMWLGERIIVNGSYEATAIDIDVAGRLIIRKDSGELIPLSCGEVSIAMSSY
jgi:BirA family biotin operon repressor/biotin-[acetyl-CoA-carboxylase] ligase